MRPGDGGGWTVARPDRAQVASVATIAPPAEGPSQHKGEEMENQSPQAEYDGHCAFGVSLGKMEVEGKENLALSDGGNTYYFSNPVAKMIWKMMPSRKTKADANWAARAS